jgi:hypothetical protein
MAFTIVQSGTALELFDPSGNYAAITLPTNVTLSALRTPRAPERGVGEQFQPSPVH